MATLWHYIWGRNTNWKHKHVGSVALNKLQKTHGVGLNMVPSAHRSIKQYWKQNTWGLQKHFSEENVQLQTCE